MKFWEVPSGKLIRTVRAHAGWVRAVTYSPDGKIIASCSDDTTIKLWDAKTGRPIRTLKGHKEPVRSVAFSPDGDRKSTRLNSSHLVISYAVFCLKKKKQ